MFRLTLILIFYTAAVAAQQDTASVTLRPAEITAARTAFRQAHLFSVQLDTGSLSKLEAHALSDRLDLEAGLFVKSYGPGSLSTLSLRGTGAAQTAVVWQGLTLNSPMLGLTDAGLLPSFLSDQVTVQYGGNGPLHGNGSVGGTITLSNQLYRNRGMDIQWLSSAGSFGAWRTGAGIRLSNGKVVTQTKCYTEHADNNFRYTRPDGTIIHQPHAGFHQYGITEDIRWGNDRDYVDAHLFNLLNERDIPPLMISELSQQEQRDEALRAAVHLNFLRNNRYLRIHTGWSDEKIHYRDPAVRLDERSRARTLQADAESGIVFNKYLKAFLQAGYQYASATVPSYSGAATQHQESLSGNILYEQGRVKLQGALRQSLFQGRWIPLLPSASFSLLLHRYITLRGDYSTVYRLPTLNDRFWQPGGNRGLKPESGYQSSAGICFTSGAGTLRVETTVNVFLVHLAQAIVWLPGSDGIYTVNNIQVLDSRGVDLLLNIKYQKRQWKVMMSGGPVYTQALITKADPSYAASLNKQIIYTPLILWKGTFELGYKTWTLRYHHTYTGYRYITTDHSHFLDPFDVAGCSLSHGITIGKHRFLVSASVKNLYNENYQVIAWRAMPGRSIEAGIFYRFEHLKP